MAFTAPGARCTTDIFTSAASSPATLMKVIDRMAVESAASGHGALRMPMVPTHNPESSCSQARLASWYPSSSRRPMGAANRCCTSAGQKNGASEFTTAHPSSATSTRVNPAAASTGEVGLSSSTSATTWLPTRAIISSRPSTVVRKPRAVRIRRPVRRRALRKPALAR
jgi:hypothetical protein